MSQKDCFLSICVYDKRLDVSEIRILLEKSNALIQTTELNIIQKCTFKYQVRGIFRKRELM